jgi:ATP-binding cassette subfamily B protein
MRLSYAAGADLSLNIYRRTLYQPYDVHCDRNSSEVINGISSKTGNAINIIVCILSLISSGIILATILIALLALDPAIALLAFGGFALIYGFIINLTRNRLLQNSEIYARESTQVIKCLHEGLGGIRDVLIDGNQAAYCKIYSNADIPLRRVQGDNMFISSSPRYAMEALGMTLIAMLAYSLAQQPNGIAKALPVLGALALGAQRLLPVLQQIYSSWSGIRGSQASLQDVLELLDQPLPNYASQPAQKPLPFNEKISLKQLDFRYSAQTPYVFKQVNLTISKGSRVGFMGVTGSGKSTLIDILMGLLQPTDGSLEIDNQKVTPANHRAWQAHIAHVPQIIFLADSSIEENIAFGVPKDQIDHIRVQKAARQAQIAETIESLPRQYQTFVGERGIRLSGGQRQRIGIARALYKRADVIVFDEATSALDNDTEQAVIEAIDGLSKDLTLLIIAHRLTTLKNCTKIFEICNGGLKRETTYEDLMNDSKLTERIDGK